MDTKLFNDVVTTNTYQPLYLIPNPHNPNNFEKINQDVKFDFTIKKSNDTNQIIYINATLFNNNTDTIYFLSSSCEGDQYSLRFNNEKFDILSFIHCNVSYPRMRKIAPKGQYDFGTYIKYSDNETKIKLGFDFYPVDKSIDLKAISLANIHHREEGKQTIIWANEKVIH